MRVGGDCTREYQRLSVGRNGVTVAQGNINVNLKINTQIKMFKKKQNVPLTATRKYPLEERKDLCAARATNRRFRTSGMK